MVLDGAVVWNNLPGHFNNLPAARRCTRQVIIPCPREDCLCWGIVFVELTLLDLWNRSLEISGVWLNNNEKIFFTVNGQQMLANQVASGLSHTLNYESVLIPLDPLRHRDR